MQALDDGEGGGVEGASRSGGGGVFESSVEAARDGLYLLVFLQVNDVS
jgi:hypothetical protein